MSFLLTNIDNAGCVYFFIFVLTMIIHAYCKLHKSQCTILHPVFSFGVFFIIKIHLYSSCLRRSYNILKEVKCPQNIVNTHVTSLIERKMTKDDVKICARHIHSQKLEPSMKHLLKWMDEKMTARLGLGATICKTGSTTHPSVNLLGADGNGNSSGERDKNQKQCYVCKASHYVDECPQFKAMTPNEQWEVVKVQKECFSCLKNGKGHTSTNCLRRKTCSEKNSDGTACNESHHKLPHLYSGEASGSLQVSTLQDKSLALLPVVTGAIKVHPNTNVFKKTAIFFDSGAQIFIIRSSLTESFSLQSKPVKILITKVGGIEEELTTKICKFPVCTSDGKAVQVIQAVGIPQISDDIREVDVTALANLFGLGSDDVRQQAGPVNVLIGIHYSRFHIGETKVKGTLVARKSPFGWVIFGSNTEDLMPQIKQVSIVRRAQPVDMTDLWKTESMGVSVVPCTCGGAKLSAQEREELKLIEESCQLQGNKWIMKYPWKRCPSILPNNYVQVRKKLESLE